MARKTRFPGVSSLGKGKYLLRFKATNHKTGKTSDHKHITDDCPNAAEAARRREALIVEHEEGAVRKDRVRLSTFIDTWIANKKATLAPSTLDRYVRSLARYVLPTLGDYFVDALTHADIVKWRDEQTGEPSSINSRLRVLKTALADAVIEHDLPRSPASRVSALPEDGYDDEAPNALTAQQLNVLLEAVRTHSPQWYALFATLAFTGARVGEVTALKWDDIQANDEDGGTIVIRRSHWLGCVRATTKTRTWRRVPLPKELGAILADHRRALIERQAEGLDEGWVFPSTRARRKGQKVGGPTLSSTVRNALLGALDKLEKAAAKKAAEAGLPPPKSPLPHFTVHGLRRTMNNLLRQTVQDKIVVRAVLGHVTERMTEHYSHVEHAEKASAVSNVISLVRRPLPNAAANTQVEAEVEVKVEVEGAESNRAFSAATLKARNNS